MFLHNPSHLWSMYRSRVISVVAPPVTHYIPPWRVGAREWMRAADKKHLGHESTTDGAQLYRGPSALRSVDSNPTVYIVVRLSWRRWRWCRDVPRYCRRPKNSLCCCFWRGTHSGNLFPLFRSGAILATICLNQIRFRTIVEIGASAREDGAEVVRETPSAEHGHAE